MKVLQLCGKDFWGAGRAAFRLHKGLQKVDVESVMWVGAKRSKNKSVIKINTGCCNKIQTKVFVKLEKWIIRLRGGRNREMFSLGSPACNLKKRIEAEKPDVVHIHWINRGFMNLNTLKGLDIPVVISLHDMWWYTGGCHYDEYCGRYKVQCGNCPVLHSKRSNDLSKAHHNRKKKVISNMKNITFVGLSNWMTSCVKESSIGKAANIVSLPNGINTRKFAPENKVSVREELGLPMFKNLILFAAVDALSETRKGYAYISNALNYLTPHYEVVIIGEKSDQKEVGGLKAHFIGEVKENKRLVKYMSAVDVAVVPSLQENLSNLIMECMSCGVPVTAFKIGGNEDMIKHKENGYLALPESAEDLAKGIEFCCNGNMKESLSKNARKHIKDNFNIKDVANKYKEFYQSVCNI